MPPDGFVFCCFNKSYKITPDVFDGWMRILRRVEGSVLWLFQDNETATANLRTAAIRRGIEAGRLVFAERQKLPDHLARHRLADLFLDTAPYNAHTTASDALWVGLPVLTRMGTTFASRVAASLLNAVGLPELITTAHEAYEAKAVALATNPDALTAVEQTLARNRLTAPLFDTARFTTHLEAAYQAMYARYQAGLPPAHIHVPPTGAPRRAMVLGEPGVPCRSGDARPARSRSNSEIRTAAELADSDVIRHARDAPDVRNEYAKAIKRTRSFAECERSFAEKQ